MAILGGIADDLLANLAEDVETNEQVEALARALGFSAAAINRYTETNIKGDSVTCKGTRDMLFDWRQTVEPSCQHLKLKQALIEVRLVMLADTYLKETSSTPDIYSEKISDSFTVGQCREKLADKYFNSFCKIRRKPWDPNDYAEFEDMHTVVTMVTEDAKGRDKKKKEIVQVSVSKIFQTKVNGKLPARLLISAPAGRGKTTAVAKIAYDWAKGVKESALDHVPLLFGLKFRNTDKRASIGEAIKSQLLSDVDDLTPQHLENFIRKHQGICDIIMDGLDEYAGISPSGESFGSNIVEVISWEEYPECRVLVTTRPHLEEFFNRGECPRVYTKMWIEGFSRESSRKYIDKFFAPAPNTSKVEGLKVYLDSHPLINELVITPLFCLIVCQLWSEGILNNDIRTQTQLLDSLNVFLMRNFNNRSKSENKITDKKLEETIREVGKVALAGLLDDTKKLVFIRQDFESVPASLPLACELGIVFKTPGLSSALPRSHENPSPTFEFYHKIAQEHSAAKYIADESKKVCWSEQTPKVESVLIRTKANIGDFENLIRFAAGTESSICITVMEALLANRFLDESERYRILLDCSSETSSTEGSMSPLIQRCVTAQTMLLKSPTVYTVVGMENLPEELKSQIREVKFEDSTISIDVTIALWSCLKKFSALRILTMFGSSLSLPTSPPELKSVKKLIAKQVTPQSYEGLLSSVPVVEEIDITIDDAERDISQIMASLSRAGGEQVKHIRLEASDSLSPEKRKISRETMRGLGFLVREKIKNLKWLNVSGVKCTEEEDWIDFVDCCRHAKTRNNLM